MEKQEVLEKTGLDWNVRIEKTFTESGIELDRIGLVREDTNEVLGVHSNGYVPYQNTQLIELLDRVSSLTGLEIHRGGEFGGGRKVFIQLKSNDLRLGNDRVEGFVTGVNSFDGSTSLAFGNSNLTISCQNTFFSAYRNLEKIRHTKNMNIKIDEICRGVDTLVAEEQEIFNTIKRMSETQFSQETKDRVIKSLFDIDMDINVRGFHDEERLSTNVKNKLSRLYIDMNGELQEKGDNVWGLFSGVTKYTTHSLSREDNSENKMFGLYGNRERKIFKELSVLV
jgi:hypothetical protein